MQLTASRPRGSTYLQDMMAILLPILAELWRVAIYSATDQRSRTLSPAISQDPFRQKVNLLADVL